jgi:flagellar biosynthesis regulator FlbT
LYEASGIDFVNGAVVREGGSRPGWGIMVLPNDMTDQRDEAVLKGQHPVTLPMRGIP